MPGESLTNKDVVDVVVRLSRIDASLLGKDKDTILKELNKIVLPPDATKKAKQEFEKLKRIVREYGDGAKITGEKNKQLTKSFASYIRAVQRAERETARMRKQLTGLPRLFQAIGRAVKIAFPFSIAFGAFQAAMNSIRAFFAEITSGIKKLDEFKLQVLEVAGILAVMTKRIDSQSFEDFKAFAEQARVQLEVLGATALATGEEIFAGFLELTERGIILQTEQDFKKLLNIVNAISLIAQGTGRPLQQIKQELRLLLEGQIRPGAELVLLIKGVNAELLDAIRNTEDMNDRFDLISSFLEPFGKVQEGINDTLRGQLSLIRTIFDIIERGAAETVFADIVNSLKAINKLLFDGTTLTTLGLQVSESIALILQVIVEFAKAFAINLQNSFRIFSPFSKEVDETAEGFSGLLSIVNNISTAFIKIAQFFQITTNIFKGLLGVATIAGAVIVDILDAIVNLDFSFERTANVWERIKNGAVGAADAFVALISPVEEISINLEKDAEALSKIQQILDAIGESSSTELITLSFDANNPDLDERALKVSLQEIIDRAANEFAFSVAIDTEEAEESLFTFGQASKVGVQTVQRLFAGLPAPMEQITVATAKLDANIFELQDEIAHSFTPTIETLGDIGFDVFAGLREKTDDFKDATNRATLEVQQLLNILRQIGAAPNYGRQLEILNDSIRVFKEAGGGAEGARAVKLLQDTDSAIVQLRKNFTKTIDEINKNEGFSPAERTKAIKNTVTAFFGGENSLTAQAIKFIPIINDARDALDDLLSTANKKDSGSNSALNKFVSTITKLRTELGSDSSKAFRELLNGFADFSKIVSEAGVSGQAAAEAFELFEAVGIQKITSDLIKMTTGLQDNLRTREELTNITRQNLTLSSDEIKSLAEISEARFQANTLLTVGAEILKNHPDLYAKLAAAVQQALNDIDNYSEKLKKANAEGAEVGDLTKRITKAINEADKAYKEATGQAEAFALAQQLGLPITKDVINELGELVETIELMGEVSSAGDIAKLEESIQKMGEAAAISFEIQAAIDAYERNLKIAQKLSEETAEAIREAFSDLIFNALQGNFDGIGGLFDNFVETIQRSLANAFAEKLVLSLGFAGNISKGEKALIDLARDRKNLLQKILQTLQRQGDTTSDAPIEFADELTDALNLDIFGTGIDGLPGALGLDLFNDIFDQGGGFLDSIGSGLGFLGDAFSGITDIFSKVAGFLGPIGQAASALIGLVTGLISLIKALFEKPPRFDLDLDQFRDPNTGKGTGLFPSVGDFLTRFDEIANVSVDRKSGQNSTKVLKEIENILKTFITDLQDTIFTLPTDIAIELNRSLLAFEPQSGQPGVRDKTAGGDRLLEFDDTGKSIQKQLDAFLGGELEARFAVSIAGFFEGALVTMGVQSDIANEKVQGIVDDFFEIKGTGEKAREARAEVGKELVEFFNAVAKTFNIAVGNVGDSATQGIAKINQLSDQLGLFENSVPPTLSELQEFAQQMIETGEVTPEAADALEELRQTIVDTVSSISASISSLISLIAQVDQAIVDLGGSSVDITGSITETIDGLINFFNEGGLGFDEQEALLGDITGLVDQFLSEEQRKAQAAADAANAAAQAAAEAQKAQIEAQIDGLREERDLVRENFRARIDALEEELDIAQDLQDLTQDIQNNILDLLTGPNSLDGIFGQIATLDQEIERLFIQFQNASPEEQIGLGARLQELINQGLSLAGDAFANPSLEFRDEFRETIERLEELEALIGPTRTIEEISAEIEATNASMDATLEAIDAQIESLREQASNIDTNTQISAEISEQARQQALEYYEFVRQEAIRLLEERLLQLQEVGIDTNSALSASEQLTLIGHEKQDTMISILEDIAITLRGANSFANGGVVSGGSGRGVLSFLHAPEFVIPAKRLESLIGQVAAAAHTQGMSNGSGDGVSDSPTVGQFTVNIHGNVDSSARVKELDEAFQDSLRKHFPKVSREEKFRRDSKL